MKMERIHVERPKRKHAVIEDETVTCHLETNGSIDDILKDIDEVLKENTLLRSASAASKELVMAENFGLSKRLQPDLKDKPKSAAADIVKPKHVSCDAHHNCDSAKFEVIVITDNSAKSLFFCGHHFRKYRLILFERSYEVKEL